MPDSVKIFHNPRCSKSRQTMQLIENNGIKVEVVEYLKAPPSIAELTEILDMLGLEPRDLMRTHEQPFKDLNLGDDNISRDALIEAMVANPILIERPIVIRDGKAIIGRPPENVLDLL